MENVTSSLNNYFNLSSEISSLNLRDPREFFAPPLILAFSVSTVTSLVFMLSTLFLYLLLPELRTLHGRCVMSYVGSIICAYICFTISACFSYKYFNHGACKAIALSIQFWYLSALSWMLAMSYDMWQSLRKIMLQRCDSVIDLHSRYLNYSTFGCGFPLAFTTFTLIMGSIPQIKDAPYSPKFTTGFMCWFDDDVALQSNLYSHGPLVVLILANTAMFVMTACRIYSVSRETKKMMKDMVISGRTSRAKKRFHIYAKMFILAGMFWFCPILLRAADKHIHNPVFSSISFWAMITSRMHGVLLFFVHIFSANVRSKLKRWSTRRLTASSWLYN